MEIQWSLVLFTALTGAAGWMFACLAFDTCKGKAPVKAFTIAVIALVVLIVGGLASVTHLSHPENILGALSHPTSGIFVEAVLVGITALFAILYLVFAKREGGEKAAKVMLIIAAVFGVVLSFMAGQSYMMAAQLSWNTFLLPLGYLGSAFATGVAVYLACVFLLDADAQIGMGAKLLLIAGIVSAVTVLAYAAVGGAFATSAVFAVIAILGAGVVPIVVGAYLPKAGNNVKTLLIVAAVCALIGAICYRCMMWDLAAPLANFFNLL